MKPEPKRVPAIVWMAGALMLVVTALGIWAYNRTKSLSDDDVLATCHESLQQYKGLVSKKASAAEWKIFQQELLPKLEAIVEDYDEHPHLRTRRGQLLRQLARHSLPELIKHRGRESDANPLQAIEQVIQQVTFDETIEQDSPSHRQVQAAKLRANSRWDPVVVGIIGFDVVLIAVGVWYRFKR